VIKHLYFIALSIPNLIENDSSVACCDNLQDTTVVKLTQQVKSMRDSGMQARVKYMDT
jgi:hypothetical protein